MMKRYIWFLFLALTFVLSSCNSDEKMNGAGLLRIGVNADTSVITKADGDDVEITKVRLLVKTKTDEGTGWSKEYDLDPISLAGEIELAPGTYELTAIAGDGSDVSDGFSPCYKGSTSVTITAGNTSEAKITCMLATVKVSVSYASNVKETYKSGFKTEVGSLSFTEDKLDVAGYLTAKPFAVNFLYKDNLGGWRTIHIGDIETVNPREYYHIKIAVENEGEGAATITIKVGKNTEDIKVEVSLPEIVIETLDAENVEYTTATLKGTYSAPSGNLPPTEKQLFYYKKKGDTSWTTIQAQKGSSDFQVAINSLIASTTYEYKFMDKGAIKELTTKTPDITLDKNYKGVTTAVVYGELAEVNRGSVSSPYFKYRSSGGNWSSEIPASLVAGSTYQYKALIKDLNANVTYEYKFMEVTVKEKQFKTLQAQPISISKVVTGADYATVSCQFVGVTNGDAILLDLKEYNGTTWNYVGREYDVNSSDISGQQIRLSQLEQNGTYCIDDDAKSFATLKNASFDEWNQNKNTWYAGTSLEASSKNCFWDSGNPGTTTLGSINPTSPEREKVRLGGKGAVKLASDWVGAGKLGKFAAGNIYVGHFVKTYMAFSESKLGANIKFGQPFSTCPNGLKGWYHYTSGTVDYSTRTELPNGQPDKCSVYMILSDVQFEVDTRDKKYVDLNSTDIIAYGELPDDKSSSTVGSDYIPFEFNLDYRKNNIPQYLVICASASKYGDYFTGSTSSVMYIDDFELIYDYTKAPYK